MIKCNIKFAHPLGYKHRVHTEWQCPLSGVYSENQPSLVIIMGELNVVYVKKKQAKKLP